MQLPTEKVAAYLKDPRMLLIYGPPKIGKTTILSQLENNLIADLEDGSGYVEALKVKVNNLDDYDQMVNLLKMKDPKPYKFLSIDTIDKIEEWSEWEATKRYRRSPLGKKFDGSSVLELPNGGGYSWLRDVFKEYTKKALGTADNIIFVGHIRDKLIEKSGGEVTTKDLDLTGKIKSIMCSSVDAIGYITRNKEGCWVITFDTKEDVVCGTRCPHLQGQTFTMPAPKVFDWSKIYTFLQVKAEDGKIT